MGDAIQILMIAAVALVVLVWLSTITPPFKSYWEAFLADFGQDHAVRFRAWRRQRHARTTPTSDAKQPEGLGVPPGLSLPHAPALVAVGPGARGLVEGRPPTAVIDFEGAADDFAQAVETAVDEAAEAVRAGRAQSIAVVLGVPMSGSWSGDEALDLARIFGAIFKHHDCPTWLAYEEPTDVSAWPDDVFLEGPERPEDLAERLRTEGLEELVDSTPVIIGRSLRLSADAGARALLLLTHEKRLGSARRLVPAISQRPQYASYLALAARTDLPWDSGFSRDLALATEVQRAMHEQGLRLTGITRGSALEPLPLTPYRGRVCAWRRGSADLVRPSVALIQPTRAEHEGVKELDQALADRDEQEVERILVRFGRAWIETADAAEHVTILEGVVRCFPEDSVAGLWARYLMALDAALRTAQPAEVWFDNRSCELARAHGPLELLFRAEQMEFTRLRGDFHAAVRLASEFAPLVNDPIPGGDVGATYAHATARFVLSNVLRSGGRYDLARRYLVVASDAYDRNIPSHAVEAMHCRYALAVCDAMDGIPHVDNLEGVPEGQRVFARSLVTLINAQAAWFIDDLDRALDFAREAATGFRSIGYARHARRADDVAAVFRLWTTRRRGETPLQTGSPIVDAMTTALNDTTGTLSLVHLRPSAALSWLEFALAFSDVQTSSRSVALPALIQETGPDLALSSLPPARTLVAADALLREAMGIGRHRPVPLLPD